jgi:hypothetical protein
VVYSYQLETRGKPTGHQIYEHPDPHKKPTTSAQNAAGTLLVKDCLMPTSKKQIAANRRNAKKSTGPTSPEGKAVASRNAIKHGLHACDIILKSPHLTPPQKTFFPQNEPISTPPLDSARGDRVPTAS